MEEVSPVPVMAPASVGETLRAAREQQGLTLGEIATRTRVPQRHLEAIETGNYNGLPSHTYASGFVKAYARAVGVDEVAINRELRAELANSGPRASEYQPYQAPDPARVPSRGLAIVSLGVALALIVLVGLWYSGMLGRDAATSPVAVAAAPQAAVVPASQPSPMAAPTPAPPAGGQVALQSTDPVWLRVHDGDKTLYIGTMKPGERFDVPANAQNPLVDVGQPDKLRVTLNGSALPALPPSQRPLKDLRVGSAAVAARLAGGVAPIAAAPEDAAPSTPAATSTPTARRTSTAKAAAVRPAPALDETARANLNAAGAAPPPPGNTQ